MARYIDADRLIAHLKDEIKACEPKFDGRANGKSVAYGTELGLKAAISFAETLDTADVAPKSEVERLEHLRAELSKEIETLKDNNEHLAVMLMEATSEVVESILYLIDDKIRFEVEVYNGFHSSKNCKTICQERVNALNDLKLIINHQFRAELKKKYTEGKV